jgi:cell division protein FtsQ
VAPRVGPAGVSAPRARIWRRRLIALGAIAAILLAGYWFWLRDSSLVAVDEVEVRGATANEAEIAAALEQRAREMTTLHVEDEKLVQAAQAFPTVASIAIDASLPDKLTITVTERLPVAVVKVDGETTGVAGDGQLLTGLDVGGQGLPGIEGTETSGGRLDQQGAAQAAILAGATEDLRKRVEGISYSEDSGGVVIELENGPEARFGDGSRADDKWRALAAVLLQPESAGAAYADVSVPERAVTGG